MNIENSINNLEVPLTVEKAPRPSEGLEAEKRNIWDKAKGIMEKLGFDFEGSAGLEKEKEIVEKLARIEQMKKGKDYDDEEDNMFLETEIEYQGKNALLKMVSQSEPAYRPDYKIDYAREMPDFQKEAERRLKREAIIGEKLPDFTSGKKISADTIEKAGSIAGESMYLVKTVEQSTKAVEAFSYDEGRNLARTLLDLQYEVNASDMVNEIMREQNYRNQYELENEFSEDIFNDFNGYMDNSRQILKDRMADGEITKQEAKRLERKMEKYRAVIEGCHLGKNEYSLVHSQCYLDKLVVGRDSAVYLSDWKNVGTTQNRELSLINDMGLAFESAREQLDEQQAEEFIKGAEDKLEDFYVNQRSDEGEKIKGRQIVEAVIKLTKLRTFAEG